MTKPLKIILIVLLALGLLLTGAYFGIRNYTRSIYDQRSCEWSSIDNIEMYAEVDIPEVISNQCEYVPEKNMKMARFVIDRKNVNLDEYIPKNNLRKSALPDSLIINDLLKEPGDEKELRESRELYIREGAYKRETWIIILDKKTGKLWVTIKYND
ncbi:hypothetical protein D3C87_21060 [compost metagenome]